MLPINNKIVFCDGDYDFPYISRIIEVLTEYSTTFEDIKEVIFDEERGRTGHRDAAQYTQNLYGKSRVVFYQAGTSAVYGWVDGRRQGASRATVISNYKRLQNGKRNAKQSKTNASVKYTDSEYLETVKSGDTETAFLWILQRKRVIKKKFAETSPWNKSLAQTVKKLSDTPEAAVGQTSVNSISKYNRIVKH